MLMTIVTSHDWNVLVVRGFLQAKIHGQDLVSLQASNSSLSREAEPCEGWTDEEAYACEWFKGDWIKSF